MTYIYSDLKGEVVVTENKSIRTLLYDRDSKCFKAAIVLENLLAAKRLRDYLHMICSQHPEYFKQCGEPLKHRYNFE